MPRSMVHTHPSLGADILWCALFLGHRFDFTGGVISFLRRDNQVNYVPFNEHRMY